MLISQSTTDSDNNGHRHNGQWGSDNVMDISMGDNINCENVSNIGVNTREYNSKYVTGNQVINVIVCEHDVLKTNVFRSCKGVVTTDKMSDNMLFYDINMGFSDYNPELSNTMLLKDG